MMMAAFLVLAAPLGASADSLFSNPGLGMAPVQVPRVVPKTVTPGVPPLNANQCLLMAGSCPTGRLQRSGNLCFCVSGNGTVRQGTTRVKPQGARPAIESDP
ncbi:hypothetical protein GGR25_002357 [Kaistia hirudinis]|uniref:Uncharacterized protein n=1 Tax=Kaistia hirudinis TaxID=1293440 RepID=A0A840AQH3_9HYPH|nr:hypothetical protein [Kaistia hirudinis]MBB3931307.1 hypothetical protein [Kaistia hirudinis]